MLSKVLNIRVWRVRRERGEGRILLKTVSRDEKLYLGTFLLNYCEIVSKISLENMIWLCCGERQIK